MSRGLKRGIGLAVLCMACLTPSLPVVAQTLASPNYRFDESTLGAGGVVQSGSANFSVTSGAGDIGVGNSASTNFQLNSGSNTPKDPYLTFTMLSSTANFGEFSSSTTSVGTTSFAVSNYTTYGYVVQMFGPPPTNGSHSIDAMTATNTSQVGVEQFGINLVANTSPTSLGANPNNGQFGYGSVMPNYATPNNYRYVEGETIARATRNSGVTVYTISYIANVAPLTPGGQYTTDQTLIVTGTY